MNLDYQKADESCSLLSVETSRYTIELKEKVSTLEKLKYPIYFNNNNSIVSFSRTVYNITVTCLLYYFNLNSLNYCNDKDCKRNPLCIS